MKKPEVASGFAPEASSDFFAFCRLQLALDLSHDLAHGQTLACESMGTVNAKKRTNVLVEWTVLLFFVHFVCGFAAWLFFLTHSSPVSPSFSSIHRCAASVSVTMGKLVPSSRVHSISRMPTSSPAGLEL